MPDAEFGVKQRFFLFSGEQLNQNKKQQANLSDHRN